MTDDLFTGQLPEKVRPSKEMPTQARDNTGAVKSLRVDTQNAYEVSHLLDEIAKGHQNKISVIFDDAKPKKLHKITYDLRTDVGARQFLKDVDKLQKLPHPVFVICPPPEHVSTKSDMIVDIRYPHLIGKIKDEYASFVPKLIDVLDSSQRSGLSARNWGAKVFAIDTIQSTLLRAAEGPQAAHYEVSFKLASHDGSRISQVFMDKDVQTVLPEQKAVQMPLGLGFSRPKNDI